MTMKYYDTGVSTYEPVTGTTYDPTKILSEEDIEKEPELGFLDEQVYEHENTKIRLGGLVIKIREIADRLLGEADYVKNKTVEDSPKCGGLVSEYYHTNKQMNFQLDELEEIVDRLDRGC